MQTRITRCTWRRRAAHDHHPPSRTREHRRAGFIGPRAARLRRAMKRRSHRRERRAVRAGLRAYLAVLAA